MALNLPDVSYPRIVIVGAGFAGLNLAKSFIRKKYQVVLLDRNNYHQFQPLFYQVAMSGLEPSSISFPIRKLFQSCNNVLIRKTELISVNEKTKRLLTSDGEIYYDKLILSMGARTNFFGNKEIEKHAFTLKSTSDAIGLRNSILEDLETAIVTEDYEKRQSFIDIVIVGGGATGVELAGAIAEMKEYILPKDYKEINAKEVDIYLIQSGDRLLQGMSEKASTAAEKFLTDLGVNVMKNLRVTTTDGTYVYTNKDTKIRSNKLIWAAGIICNKIEGLQEDYYAHANRIKVDRKNKIIGSDDIYVIGDQAYMVTEKYPKGHPQVAQVAIQSAKNLSKNLIKNRNKDFTYKDLGSMATIGRNKAVADLPSFKTAGFFAWILWLFVHLFALIGTKNKLFVLINWFWNYLTYDQSLRLIIKAEDKKV